MHLAEADFILTEVELAALAAWLAPEDGRLSLLPAVLPEAADQVAAQTAYRNLTAEDQERLQSMVMVLAAPTRVAILHTTVADETISRQFLAWDGNTEAELVFLARQGQQWRAGRRTPLTVQALVAQVLAAGPGLRSEPLSVGLTTPTVVILLAVLDQLRYARLTSLLAHRPPVTSFAPAEVFVRLADAEVEDFRWPLCFVEKVLPARLPAALTAEDVAAGLDELAQAGLVEPLADGGGAPLFALTPAGQIIADAVLHDAGKVALRLTEVRADGVLGHDAFLFVRGSFHLFLFELAGEAGVVAAAGEEQFAALMAGLLAGPAPDVAAASRPEVPEEVAYEPPPIRTAAEPVVARPEEAPQALAATSRCSRCGEPVKPKDRFCEHCGALQGDQAEKTACPYCGQVLAAGVKFCGNCGGAVAAQPAQMVQPVTNAPTPKPTPATPKPTPATLPPPPERAGSPPAERSPAGGQSENVLGVIPFARRAKGLLGLGGTTFNLVVTDQRVLFAEFTGQMMQDSVRQSREQAAAEGAGFFGKWAAGMTTDYVAKYRTMTPEAILAEQPDNFFVLHGQVRSARFREETDAEGESSGYKLRLETTGEKLELTFTDIDTKACRQLLESVWGNRVRGL